MNNTTRKIHKKKQPRIKKIIISIVAFFTLIFTLCFVYLNDYYHADLDAISVFSSSDYVTKEIIDDDTIVYSSENADIGLIFYPGGKVEYLSYEPLMESLAEHGIMCVLIKMPFNLAIFDINAATGIQQMYPNIENWYMAGHSLGGSMAASYISKNVNEFDGLILLASYSTFDLSNTSLKVISIYGSEDKVLNREKYNKNKSNLPSNFNEFVIDGGNHAFFGMYGKQDGDGIATITNEVQINKTTKLVIDYIFQ